MKAEAHFDVYSSGIPEIKIFKEDDNWTYCVRPPKETQGWKIYVSSTIHNMQDALCSVADYLQSIDIPFKFAKSRRALELLNAGLRGYSQIGKSIVIYAEHSERQIMQHLCSFLSPYKAAAPTIPFAMPIGNELPIYYRYGAYSDFTILVNGTEVSDQRDSRDLAIPEGIDDVFVDLRALPHSDLAADSFLERFPVFQTISQTGKSGVFLALDTNNGALPPVIVKLGYQNGAVQLNSLDGSAYVRREIRNYGEIAKNELSAYCPRLISCFDSPQTTILVVEYILGMNLFAEMRAGTLLLEHILSAWDIICKFHSEGYVMNDPKLANFVRAANSGRVYAVDLEMVCKNLGEELAPKHTFHVEKKLFKGNLETRDKIHFISSIFLTSSETFKRDESRSVKIDSLFRAARECGDSEIAQWTLRKLDRLVQ